MIHSINVRGLNWKLLWEHPYRYRVRQAKHSQDGIDFRKN